MFIFCCLKALKAPNDHGAKNMPTCKEALRGSSIGHAMSWTCDMLVDNHSFPSMAAPWVKKLENVMFTGTYKCQSCSGTWLAEGAWVGTHSEGETQSDVGTCQQ